MDDEIEPILAHLRERIELLRERAQQMSDERWAYYIAQNKLRSDFDEKSRLYTRIGTTKNAFTIEWIRVTKWFKTEDKKRWKKLTKYVARGKSFRVNLTAYAKPWELETIRAFEEKAEVIRREVKLLTDLIEGYDRLTRRLSPGESEESAPLGQ